MSVSPSYFIGGSERWTEKRLKLAALALEKDLGEVHEEAGAYCEAVHDLRLQLLVALAKGEVRAWGVRGNAVEGSTAERVPPDEFAAAVFLRPSELRCAIADEFALPLWRSLLIRRDEAFAVLKVRNDDEQADGVKEAKSAPRSEPNAARSSVALEIMTTIQQEEIASRGRPLKVRALGRELKRRSGLPARLADSLSVLLPETHKLPARR